MKELISEQGLRFRAILRGVAKGKHGATDMSREEARFVLDFLFSREVDAAQVGALLTAMRFKSTKVDEFLGFFDSIYEHSHTIRPSVEGLVNANGPYDGRKKYLQLSPAFAIVAASAEVPVILHSSTGLPPKKGVTTGHVLESLGIPAYLDPEEVRKNIELHGLGHLHASRFSHGIESLRPVRETLFYRSFLHSCEVLMNPAGAKRCMVGAAHETFVDRFTDVQVLLGAEHVITVRGLDGADEFPMEEVLVVEHRDGEKRQYTVSPKQFGLPEEKAHPCRDAGETARLIRETLEGKNTGLADRILYNAGIRIYLGGRAKDFQEGIDRAREALSGGKSFEKLETLARATTD